MSAANHLLMNPSPLSQLHHPTTPVPPPLQADRNSAWAFFDQVTKSDNRRPHGHPMVDGLSVLKARKKETLDTILPQIRRAEDMEAIRECQNHLPGIIQELIASGSDIKTVTHKIAALADTILKRVIEFAIAALGHPPARFAFMIMGSEGREEQTLHTDQDNAIIFEDVDATQTYVHEYFLRLGQRVCDDLNQAGYAYCKGDVMASNPKWCQPLSVWQQYFSDWIHTADHKDLLQASIFFDFKGVYGDAGLVEKLRLYLFRQLEAWPGFLRHMTENALYFKPPTGCLRKLRLKLRRRPAKNLDIKQAIMPIVDMARVYALRHRIQETNTWLRIDCLRRTRVLTHQESNELETAYSLLMQLRLAQQVGTQVTGESQPDNAINPHTLTKIEQAMVREIFRQVKFFQSKLKCDILGGLSMEFGCQT